MVGEEPPRDKPLSGVSRDFPDPGTWAFAGAAFHPRELDAFPFDVPEVALLGRSNVGKSSLLNALCGRRGVARVSHTPGRTRGVMFFRSTQLPLVLADLPGYGYAKADKAVRRQLGTLIRQYLQTRKPLVEVWILLDGRLNHTKPYDRLGIESILEQTPVRLVLTKCDGKKAQPQALKDDVRAWLEAQGRPMLPVHEVSSRRKTGIDTLRGILTTLSGEDRRT